MMTSKTKFKETEIGMIPEDWKVLSLEDCTTKITDGTHSTVYDVKEGDYFLLSCKNIKDGQILFGNNERKIDKNTLDSLRKRTGLQKGDILLTTVGTIGESSIIRVDDVNFEIQRSVAIIRSDSKKIDKNYLYHVTKSGIFKSQTHSYARGSVQKCLFLGEINKILVPVPSIVEQKNISQIFSDLDSKIENNQQMNKTLEAIGQSIFKHWFIDFEFPNEKGKPYKSSDGEMVYNKESEKEIPKGWQIKRFSEIIEVNPKRELQKGKIAKKVGMADLKSWQSWIENWTLEEYKSGQKFRNGDTLFARITPSLEHGKTAFVSILDDNEIGFGSTEFIVFSKKIISSELYIFHLSRSEEIRTIGINAMTGTSGRQRVPDDLFNHLYTILPPSPLIDEFEKITSFLFKKISDNAKEIKTLSQIRDLLLPKLMSGKIRVPVEAR